MSELELVRSPQRKSILNDQYEQILFEACSVCLNKYIPNVTLSFELLNEIPQTVFTQEFMSMILLWSPGSYTKLSILFNTQDVSKIYAQSGQTDDLDSKMAQFRMKEFSNTQGGFFRSQFGNLGLNLGMSLPFLTSGLHEKKFFEVVSSNEHIRKFYWKASVGESNIFFSAEYDLGEKSPFTQEKIEVVREVISHEKTKKQEDSGDIEFL